MTINIEKHGEPSIYADYQKRLMDDIRKASRTIISGLGTIPEQVVKRIESCFLFYPKKLEGDNK